MIRFFAALGYRQFETAKMKRSARLEQDLNGAVFSGASVTMQR
jgi:hypothetical protein